MVGWCSLLEFHIHTISRVTMIDLRLSHFLLASCACFSFLWETAPLAAQNKNWVPARQFHAVDQWRLEKKSYPDDRSSEPTSSPTTSTKKSKTSSAPVSAGNGPRLQPPLIQKSDTDHPTEDHPGLEIQNGFESLNAGKSLPTETPPSKKSVQQSHPAPSGQSRSNSSPVTILQPIPESDTSPVGNPPGGSTTVPTRSPAQISPRTPSLQPIPQTNSVQRQSTPVPVTETGDDHWIVSARRCDETQLETGCLNCLEFFHGAGPTPLQRSSGNEFFSTLQGNTPVSFFIHGSFINWRNVLIESRETARWIRNSTPNQPLRVVYFTWPSDVNIPYLLPLDVNVLGQRSSNYGFHLAHLIAQLPREQPVTLVGHSHGARLASASLHLLAGGQIDGEQLPPEMRGQRKIRLVLASAAIDRNWFNPGQLYDHTLALPENVLNLRNSADFALNAYPLTKPFGVESIGLVGPKPQDREQLGIWNNKFVDMELAPILGSTHTWPNYYNEPELAAAIAPYVYHQPLQETSKRQKPASSSLPVATNRQQPPLNQAPHNQTRQATTRQTSAPYATPVDVVPVYSRPTTR